MTSTMFQSYMSFVPEKNPLNTWQEVDGLVVIEMVHRSLGSRILQTVFRTPNTSHITLDEHGSFIWKQIDGEKNVAEIAAALHMEYGKEVEPARERIKRYLNILRNNRFIYFKGKDPVPQ